MRKIGQFTVGLAFLLLLLLSFPGIADLFNPSYYSSHDGMGHVIRMEEFFRSFNDGQIPVRWSERLYFGYGYPFYNFNYPSIYYLGLPFMKAGLSAVDVMKGETVLFFVLSGALMFYYLRRVVPLPYALLGAVLYLYAPYRMSNIYVRGSVAEAMMFIFPPLLLWGAEVLASPGRKGVFWVALLVGIMGISHNISALLLSAFFFGYLVFLSWFHKSFQPVVKGTVAFILGILLAGFFVVPALAEKKWTLLDLTIAKDYPNYFVHPWLLIDPRWGYGSAESSGGMTLNLGWVQLGLTSLSLLLIERFSQQKNKALTAFSWLIFLVSVFFMLSISKFFWDRVPLLPFVQFPWRFTMLTVPVMTILGTLGLHSFLTRFRERIQWLVIFILIAAAMSLVSFQWQRYQTEYSPSFPGDAIPGSSTWAHEQATRWLATPDRIPADKIENAQYKIKLWKTGEHDYTISTTKDSLVTENTMYYPGWEISIDGKETEIDYDNGKINYAVSPGTHEVLTKFTETPLRKTVDIISLVVFGFVVLSLLLSYVVPQVAPKH